MRRIPSHLASSTTPIEQKALDLECTLRALLGLALLPVNLLGQDVFRAAEILFIDGKHAIQGAGSEDYFCESYGLRQGCFPYFGVPLLEEPFTSAYRWHLPDPVPFRKSLRFSIEQGNGTPPFKSHNDYYSVAYWYQTEPHAQFPKLASGEEGVGWATERQTTK